ncbi:MAG: AAA family ATPase [Gemmataceae bacterium]|nr:AAA family ATPase [Gemmataceae bacterium]
MIRSVEIKGLRGIRTGSLTDLTPLVVLVGPNGAGKSTILDALLIAANPRPPEGIGQAVERREGLSSGAREEYVGTGPGTSTVEQRETLSARARWLLWKAGQEEPAQITLKTDSGLRNCTFSIAALSGHDATITGKVRDQDAGGKTSEGEIITVFEAGQCPRASGFFKPLDDVPEVRFLDPRAGGLRTPLHQLYTRVVERGLHRDAIATIRALIPAVEDILILAPEDVPVVYLSFG